MKPMDMMKLYPEYVRFDRRQDEKNVDFDRRSSFSDRRNEKRAMLNNKINKDISVSKVILGYLFSH